MEALLFWLGVLSVVMFVLSLLLLPWFLGRIPVDYFSRPREVHSWQMLLRPRVILRNVLGLPVVLAGIAMLVLPGQGILTIMVGLGIMIFPGKYDIERWFISRKGVLKAVNWVRRKEGREALKL